MNIFQIAQALGGDDLTSPTIPFTGPVGPTSPVPTTGLGGPSILLQSNVVTLKKGEQAKVEVVIFTDSKEIKGFKFKISYNPSILKVIDADTATPGTQITYQNTFFNQKSNSVSSSGEILFEAAATEGVSTITKRVTAYFNVEAIDNGSSNLSVVKADSALLDALGADILQSVNSITMNVASEVVTVTATTTVTPIPQDSGTPNPSTITPRTGFIDDLGYTNAIIIGTLLIISGIYLFKKKNNDDLH